MSDLKGMKLHEVRQINIEGMHAKVIKVPGGWLYKIGSPDNYTTTFVPATELALHDVVKDTPKKIEFDDNVDDNNKPNPPATGLAGSQFGTI